MYEKVSTTWGGGLISAYGGAGSLPGGGGGAGGRIQIRPLNNRSSWKDPPAASFSGLFKDGTTGVISVMQRVITVMTRAMRVMKRVLIAMRSNHACVPRYVQRWDHGSISKCTSYAQDGVSRSR